MTGTGTKERLQQLMSGGSSTSDFDRLVKERVKNRKEKDDHSIATLKVQIAQLENAMEAEIKRRIASHAELEQSFTTQLKAVEERLEAVMEDKSKSCEMRLEAVEVRVQDLNDLLHEQLLTKVPAELEKESQALSQQLQDISLEFQTEKRELLAREGRILKQVLDYETSLSQTIQEERSSMSQQIQELQEQMKHQKQQREQSDANYAALVDKELGNLKKALERESRARQVEDDAIVDAMNRYTTKLQKTLNSITSDD